MAELLERTDFDAVFVASDVVALGAIGALREAGRRVPDDVSVVGFDDIPLAAYFDPPLTTVRLPAFELGQAAGRALLERIADRRDPGRGRCSRPSSSCAPRRPPPRMHRPARLSRPSIAQATARTTGSTNRERRTTWRSETIRWRRTAGLLAAVGSSRRHAAAAAAATHRRRAAPPASIARRPRRVGEPGGSAARRLRVRGARRRGQRLRDLDRRRAGHLRGDDRAVAGVHRRRRSTTPASATSHGALTAGIAGGNLPDVAGLPGPGQMQQWYAEARSLPLDFVDFAAYEAATPPGFAALGKAPDGKLAGIFTKGAVKGLIWYNTGVWQGGAPATWDELKTAAASRRDRRHEDRGASASSPAATPAGRAPTGSRTSSCARPAPTSTTAGSPARTPWTDPAIKAAFESSATPWRTPTAARTTSTPPPSARPRTRCSPTRPAACSTTRRASSPTSSSRGRRHRRPVRLLPVPGHRPGQLRRDRRRRPVRHVQRHARRRSR